MKDFIKERREKSAHLRTISPRKSISKGKGVRGFGVSDRPILQSRKGGCSLQMQASPIRRGKKVLEGKPSLRGKKRKKENCAGYGGGANLDLSMKNRKKGRGGIISFKEIRGFRKVRKNLGKGQ